MNIILQKIIAGSGLCSRREAERLIKAGKVKVNGQKAVVGELADPEIDEIRVSGRLLPQTEKKIYIKLNKPVGYTCSNRRFPGEKNVFDLVRTKERLFSVGRLDKDSRGLLLLTNDGAWAQKLSHPRFGQEKRYEVKLREPFENPKMAAKKLLSGFDIGEGDGRVKAAGARYLQNDLFIITLNEGKKRQIRRMFQKLGAHVVDLKRISFGALELGDLPEGRFEYLNPNAIDSLRKK